MGNKTLIIAEAGVNHNGDIDLAKKMIEVAANAGADFVKFQTFQTEHLVIPSASKANYQIENTQDNSQTQMEMLKKLELSENDHKCLMNHCKENNIQFLSTPFSTTDIDYLEDKVAIYKIPSGEITNTPYINKMASKLRPIILSTGMSTMEEIKEAVEIIKNCWKSSNVTINEQFVHENISLPYLTILHCNTAYPTPIDDVNLLAMKSIKNQLHVDVGYSDHTLGIEVPIAAVALGAKVIEKHFTLDRNLPGPDHKASLLPNELAQMISSIRNIESSLGDGIKKPSPSEKENISVARKSLYYASNFLSGHQINESDILVLRPGNGLAPKNLDNIKGKKLNTNVPKYAPVDLNHFS